MAVETHIHAFPRHVASKTYPEAVPVYDTTSKRIRIGDGSTVGGTEVPNMTDLAAKAAASDLTALAGRVTTLESVLGSFESQAREILGVQEEEEEEEESEE